MLRTVLMAVVIFVGADVIMFDGKYTDSAKHVSDRVLLYFGLK
jgi:hypothetical protein